MTLTLTLVFALALLTFTGLTWLILARIEENFGGTYGDHSPSGGRRHDSWRNRYTSDNTQDLLKFNLVEFHGDLLFDPANNGLETLRNLACTSNETSLR